jgi:hypothetical protein
MIELNQDTIIAIEDEILPRQDIMRQYFLSGQDQMYKEYFRFLNIFYFCCI